MTRFTIDANILFYAMESSDPRQAPAIEMMDRARRADCLIALQAYGEFFAAATRKQRLTHESARLQIGLWMTVFGPPMISTATALTEAMAAAASRRFSFWDAMLLATAAAAGCTAIISGDMAPRAQLGPIRVIPAFAGAEVSPEARALLA